MGTWVFKIHNWTRSVVPYTSSRTFFASPKRLARFYSHFFAILQTELLSVIYWSVIYQNILKSQLGSPGDATNAF